MLEGWRGGQDGFLLLVGGFRDRRRLRLHPEETVKGVRYSHENFGELGQNKPRHLCHYRQLLEVELERC
jgi:hypothetical protein